MNPPTNARPRRLGPMPDHLRAQMISVYREFYREHPERLPHRQDCTCERCSRESESGTRN